MVFAKEIMEYIPCPVCNCEKFKIYFRIAYKDFKNDKSSDYSFLGLDDNTIFDIRKCLNCNFVFVNPRLREEHYRRCYNEAKTSKYNFDNPDYFPGSLRERSNARKGKYIHIQYLMACLSLIGLDKELSLLDYGCGFGRTISLAEEFGIDSYGIEIDQFRKEFCKRLGLKAYSPIEFKDNFPDKKVDIVISEAVIEHVNDIKAYFEFIGDCSKKGTIFFVSGITPRMIDIEIRKGKLKNVHPIEHVNFFSVKLLDNIMKRYSFIPCGERDFSLRRGTTDFAKGFLRMIINGNFRLYPTGNFKKLYRRI